MAIKRAGGVDTTSVVVHSGFTVRAEICLPGNDALSIKTTGIGGFRREAMTINPDSAEVCFPQTLHFMLPPVFNLLGDAGRCASPCELQRQIRWAFVAPPCIQTYGGAAIAEGAKFINNTSSQGGVEAPLDPLMDDVMDRIHPGPTGANRRYGPEF